MILQRPFWITAAKAVVLTVSLILIGLGVLMSIGGAADAFMFDLLSAWSGAPPMPDWLVRMHTLGVELWLSGLAILALGWLALPRRAHIAALARQTHIAARAALLLVVIFWLPLVLFGQSTVIAGERYWWLGDDAMISMRYAHNLAQGHGLVWNPGERVEGYTNFLWTMFMALVHVLPLPLSRTALVVLIANLLLGLAHIPLLVRLAGVLGMRGLAVAALLAGYALNRSVVDWTTKGFETALLSLLFLLAAYRILREAQVGQVSPLTFTLIGLLALVRADALLLSLALIVLALLLNRQRVRVLLFAALALALPAAQQVFRLAYYGEWMPNTAYLKTSGWDERVAAGWQYTLAFLREYALWFALAAAGTLATPPGAGGATPPGAGGATRRREAFYLLGICLAFMAYVTYAGGDAFPNYRFFVPLIPLIMALALAGLQALPLERLRAALARLPGLAGLNAAMLRAGIGAVCLLSLPVVFPGYSQLLIPNRNDYTNIEIALLIRQNTPPDARVADSWAGAPFYFSGRYGIDLLGKSDPYIARLPVASDGTKPGHNKFDYDYSLGVLKPDVVVANFRLPLSAQDVIEMSSGDAAFSGQLYLNPVFRQHCLNQPVGLDTARTIFLCDWSPLAAQYSTWENLK